MTRATYRELFPDDEEGSAFEEYHDVASRPPPSDRKRSRTHEGGKTETTSCSAAIRPGASRCATPQQGSVTQPSAYFEHRVDDREAQPSPSASTPARPAILPFPPEPESVSCRHESHSHPLLDSELLPQQPFAARDSQQYHINQAQPLPDCDLNELMKVLSGDDDKRPPPDLDSSVLFSTYPQLSPLRCDRATDASLNSGSASYQQESPPSVNHPGRPAPVPLSQPSQISDPLSLLMLLTHNVHSMTEGLNTLVCTPEFHADRRLMTTMH